jgi:membrane associated rhomboid family serine protease
MQRGAARRGVVINWGDGLVTRLLVAANLIVYLITVAQGRGVSSPGGQLFAKWILYGPLVGQGDWWRLITAAFLHGGLLHIALNMWVLWLIGPAVEGAIGRSRFLLLYFVCGLAGSAGALVWNPLSPVVGASGAIFGLFGAGAVLEWRATGRIAGQFAMLIGINLVITLAFSSYISAGGHIGGLIGGVVGGGLIVWRGRFKQLDPATVVGLLAIGAASVAIAYAKVHGY